MNLNNKQMTDLIRPHMLPNSKSSIHGFIANIPQIPSGSELSMCVNSLAQVSGNFHSGRFLKLCITEETGVTFGDNSSFD